jgi:hypothetical protein
MAGMSILRRMTERELPAVLGALAQGGSTPRTAESWAQDRMTALVLGEGEAVDAVMPMARRAIRTSGAGGVTMAAGWLSANQFASRMGLRRATRETFGEWPALLPEVDCLLVVRRDERSLAARWYGHTGFHEVLSIRCLYLEGGAPVGGGEASRYHVQTAGVGELGKWTGEMAAVYRDVFGATGGAAERTAGFWEPALKHHFYREHYQFQVLGLWTGPAGEAGSVLMGYAVVGWSGWHSKRPRMDVLELATRQWDTGAASALIRAACELAWSKNVQQVRAVVSAHDPYRGHLARSGFVDRWGYVLLAKWLHPQRHLDRVAAMVGGEVGEVAIGGTGLPPLVLRGGRGAGTGAVRVEGDGGTVTRLLLNRLDIPAAAAAGGLRVAGGGEGVLTGLAAAFPWTPWVFHMVDYI